MTLLSTLVPTAVDRPAAPPTTTAPRRDIQVLRALAVTLVVLYHLWPNVLPGGYVGVDVFFVVSGFLITSHLLRHPPRRPRDLAAFWGRRVRRLLPAASLVLLVTVVASVALLPSGLMSSAAHEAVRATFYVENWSLAQQSTDYLAADATPTPVQHFWSLAVEEQFYLLWPVLIGVLAVVGRRLGRLGGVRRVAGVGVLVVVGWSLLLGMHLTVRDPAPAYFLTRARLWELALGGLVAVVGSRRALAPRARAAIAWAGLAAILVAAVRFTADTPFPGTAALLPTLGVAAVVWADTDDARRGPSQVLGRRAVVGLGGVSYSLYLWHWPLVVLVPFVVGSVLTWPTKLGVLAASVLLAAATKRWVEDPVRTSTTLTASLPRTFLVGALCMALTASAATAAQGVGSTRLADERATFAAAQASEPDCFGAQAARDDGCDLVGDELFTSPTVAATDTPDAYRDGCWNNEPYGTRHVCTYGSTTPTRRVALLGNSHAGHWLPALQQQVDDQGWQLSTYLASACYTVDVPIDLGTADGRDEGCADWNDWAVGAIVDAAPDLVVMSEMTLRPLAGVADDDQSAAARSAYARVLARFTDAGIPVLVVRDTPSTQESAPDCVARQRSLTACATDAADAIPTDPLADAGRADDSGLVDVLDVNDLLCPGGTCRDVIGGVIVFFDYGHLTATFARTLRPEVEQAVADRIA